MVEIAHLPNADVDWSEIIPRSMLRNQWMGPAAGHAMESGWTRFSVGDIVNSTLRLHVLDPSPGHWLSQANHIFNRLRITSDFENYLLVRYLDFDVQISSTTEPTKGYLFVCPRNDLRIAPTTFRWPVCPAYWSLDPSGFQRLGPEEATRLGFPSLHLTMGITGRRWDAETYAGLRRFHEGKGFDPYSPDVAVHLGHRLYQLSFGHVDAEVLESDEDHNPELSLFPGDFIPPKLSKVLQIQLGLIIFLALCRVYDLARR
ncbi:hypothetical protein DFH06DRAFT_509868 [Mycena polygramma]|nr:hypothetical protein DFH06DRAFT_509868 [Mycena polygramma]